MIRTHTVVLQMALAQPPHWNLAPSSATLSGRLCDPSKGSRPSSTPPPPIQDPGVLPPLLQWRHLWSRAPLEQGLLQEAREQGAHHPQMRA